MGWLFVVQTALQYGQIISAFVSKMILRSAFYALGWAPLATVQAAQPSAPSPLAAPVRELPWGQLNFLHTTDSHGWHAGHLQEYSI